MKTALNQTKGAGRFASLAWLIIAAAILLSPAGNTYAVMVNLVQHSSQTDVASMANGTSPIPSFGALDALARQLGLPEDGFAYIDSVIPLPGGAMGATFASGSPPYYNTQIITRPNYFPWEAIAADITLTPPLRLVAQPPTDKGHQNTVILGEDYTSDGLPGRQFFVGGVINDMTGGVLSLRFDAGQTSFGFNIAGLDVDQPEERYIYINFYDEVAKLLDLLTIRIPKFSGEGPSRTGVAILTLSTTRPFYGLSLTTDDPAGFATGDFRFVPIGSTPSLLAFLGLLWIESNQWFRRSRTAT